MSALVARKPLVVQRQEELVREWRAAAGVSDAPKAAACEDCGRVTVVEYEHCHKTRRFRGWVCQPCNRRRDAEAARRRCPVEKIAPRQINRIRHFLHANPVIGG